MSQSRIKALYFLFLIFIPFFLFSQITPQKTAFSTGILQRLYTGTDAVQVYQANNWHNLAYVAVSKDGVYRIDVWNLSNIQNPLKTDSLYFGTAEGSRVPFIPLAIHPVDSVLLIQARQKVFLYRQSETGKLSPIDTVDFTIEGNVSQQLFAQGVNGSMLQRDPKSGWYDHRLVNFSNPAEPAFVYRNLAYLPAPVVTGYDGNPVVYDNGLLTGKFVASMLVPDGSLEQHIDQMWKAKIERTLNGPYASLPLPEIIESILSGTDLKNRIEPAVAAYLQHVGLDRYTPEEWVLRQYTGTTDLGTVLNEQGIALDEPVSFALRKLVYRGNTAPETREWITGLYAETFEKLVSGLFPLIDKSQKISEVYARMNDIFLMDYSSSENRIAEYTTKKLIAPLLDNPDCLLWTTDELLGKIAASEASQTIDPMLQMVDKVLETGVSVPDFIASTLGLDLDKHRPDCMDWPETTQKLLELILYRNGASISPDGLAWFEMVKYIAYLNGTDFDKELEKIDKGIKEQLEAMSESYAHQIIAGFDFQDVNQSIEESIQKHAAKLPVQTLVEDALVSILSSQLHSLGIDPGASVRSTLTQIGFPMRFDFNKGDYLPNGTVEDLLKRIASVQTFDKAFQIPYNVPYTGGVYQSAIAYQNPVLLTKITAQVCMQPGFIEKAGTYLSDALMQKANEIFGTGSSLLNARELMEESIIRQFDLGNLVALQVYKLFSDFFDTAFGYKSATYVVNNYHNALFEGDCLAQWMLFTDALQGFSALDPTSVTSIMSSAMKSALNEAYSLLINFIFKELAGEIIDQVTGECGGHWPSWAIRNQYQALAVTAPEKTHQFGDLFTQLVEGKRSYTLYYKRTEDFTNNRMLTLLINDNIQTATGINQVIDLGKWKTVDFTYADGDYLWIGGNVYLSGDKTYANGDAVILDCSQTPPHMAVINGNALDGPFLTAARKFKKALNDQYFMVTSHNNVFLMPNTFQLTLSPLNPTNLEEQEMDERIRVLPNPSTGLFRITGVSGSSPVSLFDARGIQLSQSFGPILDLTCLKSGIYYCRVGGKIFKLIKE